MEVLHTIWLENRTADEITADERTVLLGELGRLADNAKRSLEPPEAPQEPCGHPTCPCADMYSHPEGNTP
jgi:hypothetical protein